MAHLTSPFVYLLLNHAIIPSSSSHAIQISSSVFKSHTKTQTSRCVVHHARAKSAKQIKNKWNIADATLIRRRWRARAHTLRPVQIQIFRLLSLPRLVCYLSVQWKFDGLTAFCFVGKSKQTLSNHRNAAVLIITVVSKVVVAPTRTTTVVDYDWKPVLLVSAATIHDGNRFSYDSEIVGGTVVKFELVE